MSIDKLYSFVYRGHLTVDSIERGVGNDAPKAELDDLDFMLAKDALDARYIEQAERAARVYVIIAAFENSVRELIATTLKENAGENWWNSSVSEKIRQQAESRIAE